MRHRVGLFLGQSSACGDSDGHFVVCGGLHARSQHLGARGAD